MLSHSVLIAALLAFGGVEAKKNKILFNSWPNTVCDGHVIAGKRLEAISSRCTSILGGGSIRVQLHDKKRYNNWLQHGNCRLVLYSESGCADGSDEKWHIEVPREFQQCKYVPLEARSMRFECRPEFDEDKNPHEPLSNSATTTTTPVQSHMPEDSDSEYDIDWKPRKRAARAEPTTTPVQTLMPEDSDSEDEIDWMVRKMAARAEPTTTSSSDTPRNWAPETFKKVIRAEPPSSLANVTTHGISLAPTKVARSQPTDIMGKQIPDAINFWGKHPWSLSDICYTCRLTHAKTINKFSCWSGPQIETNCGPKPKRAGTTTSIYQVQTETSMVYTTMARATTTDWRGSTGFPPDLPEPTNEPEPTYEPDYDSSSSDDDSSSSDDDSSSDEDDSSDEEDYPHEHESLTTPSPTPTPISSLIPTPEPIPTLESTASPSPTDTPTPTTSYATRRTVTPRSAALPTAAPRLQKRLGTPHVQVSLRNPFSLKGNPEPLCGHAKWHRHGNADRQFIALKHMTTLRHCKNPVAINIDVPLVSTTISSTATVVKTVVRLPVPTYV